MSMRVCPTLHLVTNLSKPTACIRLQLNLILLSQILHTRWFQQLPSTACNQLKEDALGPQQDSLTVDNSGCVFRERHAYYILMIRLFYFEEDNTFYFCFYHTISPFQPLTAVAPSLLHFVLYYYHILLIFFSSFKSTQHKIIQSIYE